jgi:PAS domain S-box-containing protein
VAVVSVGPKASITRAGLVGLESHLLDRVDAAVLAIDLQGRILFANRYAETLYGWSREETVGRLASEFSGVDVEPGIASEILEALTNDKSWEGTFQVRRKDGSLVSVHAIDSPLYDSMGNLTGVVSLATDATRERVEGFLVDCSTILGSSLDFTHNLTALAELTVPFLGDICFIDLSVPATDDTGAAASHDSHAIRRVAAAHVDPAKQALVEELGRRYPPDPKGPHPAVEALRSGATFYLSDVTDDVVRALTRDDNHYRLVTQLGFKSFMVAPLLAHGRALGAVTIISCTDERRFGPEDVELLSEVAHRAAVALDNATLFDDQQRARAEAESSAERLLQLQTLATALSRAVTVDEVTKVIGAIAMPQLGSLNRGLWLVNEREGTVDLVRGFDLRGLSDKYASIPLDSQLPAAEVVRTRTAIFVSSAEERDTRFPELQPVADEGHAFAAVPLIAEERILGVFALGFEEDHVFNDDETRFLTAVADQCAQALARSLLYDRERLERDRAERDRRRIQALNKALQTSLLPPTLPLIASVELEARYQPALAGLEVGGDFYDVFDTGGDWAVVIGDVCGKGPEAAAVTAIARWTIRSVAMDIRQPTQVLRKVNEALVHQQLDDRFCTIAYARVVPTSQGVRVSVCRGGHPAPLVVRADGTIEACGAPGSLIGILPEVRLWEETAVLASNDALVLYTDGVTEARRGREQFGDERLRRTLEACHGQTAAHIADAIERAVLDFAGPEPNDDIAIVVLRVR